MTTFTGHSKCRGCGTDRGRQEGVAAEQTVSIKPGFPNGVSACEKCGNQDLAISWTPEGAAAPAAQNRKKTVKMDPAHLQEYVQAVELTLQAVSNVSTLAGIFVDGNLAAQDLQRRVIEILEPAKISRKVALDVVLKYTDDVRKVADLDAEKGVLTLWERVPETPPAPSQP